MVFSQIAVSDCFARANVCGLRGCYTIRAFRGIGTCRKIDSENKHGQTVLRKQDEWRFSGVVQKHSGERPKQRTR